MKRKREIGYKDNYAILVEQSQNVFLSIRMENGKRVLKRRRRKHFRNKFSMREMREKFLYAVNKRMTGRYG